MSKEAHREFFAKLMTAQAGVQADSRLAAAFAATPRERFLGAPPWKVFTRSGYVEMIADDPSLLYQDIVVSLGKNGINNGQPSLHAVCLAALKLEPGERVVHIGAGTGYYTALLARLVGDTGVVDAFEIDSELAAKAQSNLAELPQVKVHAESGTQGPLPECDVLYVNASATHPLPTWLDALRPNGRLLFPLAPEDGSGAMLLISHHDDGSYAARFLMQVQFIPCIGAQDNETSKKLAAAFRKGGWEKVRLLYRDNSPDDTAWCIGNGWWLSTAETSARRTQTA
jgi:protein-L-isoaspartate(D-aspartate) O-methyltransferase